MILATSQHVYFCILNGNLAPSIASFQASREDFFYMSGSTTNYIREFFFVRECIFILSGLPAELFSVDDCGVYKVIYGYHYTL